MNFINLTPHAITVVLPSLPTERVFEPSGNVARVAVQHGNSEMHNGVPITEQGFGEIMGLPTPEKNTRYIVSAIVLTAAKADGRTDCVAPDTTHATRNEAGHIVSVPGFVC